jgi:hypothetical protein
MECRQRNIPGSTLRSVVLNDLRDENLLEQNLPIVTSGSAKFVVRGNRLLINYIDQTDHGRYVCHAVNNYDRQGQRAEYNLRVLGKEDASRERERENESLQFLLNSIRSLRSTFDSMRCILRNKRRSSVVSVEVRPKV